MFKKLGVVLISLIATFSVVYAMNSNMSAAGTTYSAGGQVTGRIGDLQRGDTVYLYTSGYEMQLFLNNIRSTPKATNPASSYGPNVWYTQSNKINETVDVIYDKTSAKDANGNACAWDITTTSEGNGPGNTTTKSRSYECSNLRQKVEAANNALDSRDRSLIMNRPIYLYSTSDGTEKSSDCSADTCYTWIRIYDHGPNNKLFLIKYNELVAGNILSGLLRTVGTNTVDRSDLAFSTTWLETGVFSTPNYQWMSYNTSGEQAGIAISGQGNIRYSAYLDLNNVVFSMSNGTSSSIAEVKPTEVKKPLYTSIGKTMKIRFLDSSLTATLNQIKNRKDANITQTIKDSTVYLDASANQGSSSEGINTVSAFIFDSTGELKYYFPLEAAKGTDKYAFDTTGLPVGKYQIAIVNEVYDSSKTSPSTSSAITAKQPLEIVEPHAITYTASPKNQATYEYDKNVEAGDKIGTLTRSDGVVPIHYDLVADGSDTTFQNFEITGLDAQGNSPATSLDVKVKASGAPNLVSSTNSLKAGTYKFCIVSKDANGDPVTDVIDENKVCKSLVVYPSASQLVYEQTKNSTTELLYTVDELNDLSVGSNLATLTFSDGTLLDSGGNVIDDANIDVLVSKGYTIKKIQLVAPGTTTDISQLETGVTSDLNVFDIKKKDGANFVVGDIIFDALVTWEKDGAEVASLRKSNLEFKIPSGLKFADPESPAEFLEENKYTHTYVADPSATAKNEFVLTATDNARANIPNSDVTYCILDENKLCTSTSEAISFLSGATAGSQKVKASEPGSEDKTVLVKAMTKDSSGNIVMSSVITLTIKRPTQKLEWYGSNIQKTGNNITKVTTASNPTWTLSLDYVKPIQGTSETIESVNTHKGVEAYENKDKNKAATIVLRTNVYNTGTTNVDPQLHINYSITPSDPTDAGKVKIVPDASNPQLFTLVITGELKGSITILAKADATTNFKETVNVDDPSTPANDVTTATLILKVSTNPSIVYTPTPVYASKSHVETGSNEAKGTTKFGDISLSPTQSDPFDFEIGNVKMLDEEATRLAQIIDPTAKPIYITMTNDNFLIKNGKELFAKSSTNGLSKGTYVVTLKGHKSDDATVEADSLDVTIIIKDKTADISKIKWQGANDLEEGETSLLYEDVGGQIQSVVVSAPDAEVEVKQNRNSETYKKEYEKDGFFFVQVANKGGTYLNNETVIKYEVAEGSSAGIIKVIDGNIGKFQMEGASGNDDQVWIKATIKNNGYENTVVYVPIKIEKGIAASFKFVKSNNSEYALANEIDPDPEKYAAQTFTYTKDSEKAKLDIWTVGAPLDSDVTIKIEYSGTYAKNDVLKFAGTAQSNADTDNPKVCVIKKEDYATKHFTECQTMIENALYSQTNDRGKVVLSASIDETANYKSMKIEMPINVKKAENSDWNFKEEEIYVESNTNGAFSPEFFVQDTDHPNVGSGIITLFTAKPGAVADFDSSEMFFDDDEYNADADDFYEGFKTYCYNIVVPEDGEEEEKVGYVYAQKAADRNFDQSALKPLKVHILKEGTSLFTVKLNDYPKVGDRPVKTITYGDAYFELIASTPDDRDDENVTYTYTMDSTATEYIETYGDGGNTFKPLKVGEKVKINITRKSGAGIETKSTTSVTIVPRTVKLKIEDVTKMAGVVVLQSDYKLTDTSDDFLAQDKDKITIKYSCIDSDGEEVTDLVDGVRKTHDQLPITATVETIDPDDKVLSNYKIVNSDGRTLGVEKGKLIVNETESKASWYEVKPGMNAGNIETIKGMNDWYNGNVDIFLKPASGSYDLIAPKDDVGEWKSVKFTVATEGNNEQDIYFRMSSGVEKGRITKPQIERIKIDTVKPVVKSIEATLTHTDTFSRIINAITFGTFMKPGEKVTITTADVQANRSVDVSTTKDIADGITYTVYHIKPNGTRGDAYVDKTTTDSNTNGIGTISLDDPGVYEVCAIVRDQAGNISEEKCEKLLVKSIGFDVDGDGKPDNLDPDNDGCPDINIALKDETDSFYKINVDRDGDNLPDLNIDSDGDGKADINVDTDKDGKPDLNLLIITKEMWKPTFCVTGQSEEYCTVKGLKPTINVDVDGDGIPDIDIDNIGDFKPHLNISKDGKTPALNIVKLHEWKPGTDYKKDSFEYDSIGNGEGNPKPETNIDTNNDGLPDVNVDLDGDGKEDINIDTDGDGIPDVDIDGDGDGIPDINIDTDKDGKPDKDVIILDKWDPVLKGDKDGFIFGTGDIKRKDELEDGGVIIGKPGGAFLPNFAIKVTDVTEKEGTTIKDKIKDIIDDQVIKNVLDVNLWKDGTQVQPDGTIRVKVPVDATWKNPSFVIELEDGTFKKIDGEIKDGYFVYDTDYLGKLTILSDDDSTKDPTTDPDPTEKPGEDNTSSDNNSSGSNSSSTTKNPDTSVKGAYTSNATGGALTGDSTNVMSFMFMGIIAFGCIAYGIRSLRKRNKRFH